MNAHNPIDRSALILGALNLTESNRDPIAELRERNRRYAMNRGVCIETLIEALYMYRKTTADQASHGRDTEDNDYARLQVLVAINDVEHTDEMDTLIEEASRDLGIDEDATDDSFREQVRADYEAGRL